MLMLMPCQVQEMLRRMEYCETLFPSIKQLEKEHPNWATPQYKARVKVRFCFWRVSNIVAGSLHVVQYHNATPPQGGLARPNIDRYVHTMTNFHHCYFWKIPPKTDYDIFPPILGLGPRSSAANFWPQLEIGGNRDEGVGSVNSDLTEVAVRINLSKYEKIDDPSKMIFFTGREKQPTKHGRTFEGNLRSKSLQSRPRIPD